MVWINTQHINEAAPPGYFGGSKCICPECSGEGVSGVKADLLIVDEFSEEPAPTTEETLIYYRDLLYEACKLFDTPTETCWLSELPSKIRELQEKAELFEIVSETQQAWIDQQKEEIRRLKTEQNSMVSLELYEKSAAKTTQVLEFVGEIGEFLHKMPCFSSILGGGCCGCCDLTGKLNNYRGLLPKSVEIHAELNETVDEEVPAIEPQFTLHGIVKGIAEELKAGRNPFQVTSADYSEEIVYHSQSSTAGRYEWEKE